MLPQPPMARIPYPDADAESPFLTKLPPLNIFRMLAWSDPALKGLSRMGSGLLYQGKLDPVLRELVIVRVGRLCGSEYEVHQHEHVLRKLGVDDTVIAGLGAISGATLWDGFPAGTREALSLADAMVVGDDTSALVGALRDLLGEEAAVELTVLVGYYWMVSRVLTTLEVEIEEDHAFLDL